jgi:quinate dehydrogenase
MIEQGYAQQRMWIRGSVDPLVGSDPTILGQETELAARELVIAFKEYVQDPMFIAYCHTN